MAAELLKEELKTYETEKNNLLAEADGKYVLIRGAEVVGTYYSQEDAIAEGYRKFGNVPFLVKQVTAVETPANIVSSLLDI